MARRSQAGKTGGSWYGSYDVVVGGLVRSDCTSKSRAEATARELSRAGDRVEVRTDRWTGAKLLSVFQNGKRMHDLDLGHQHNPATVRAVDFASSEDPIFTCEACGRRVKRAVGLDGLSKGQPAHWYGLDCAATLMGRPRGRSTYRDLELEARKAAAATEGRIAGEAARAAHGNERSHSFPNGTARGIWRRSVLSCPYPENSMEYHAWWDAASDALR